MVKRFISLIFIAVSLIVANDSKSDDDKLGTLLKKVEEIQSKAGISFGGVFRSQYIGSKLLLPDANYNMRNQHNVMYTSVDFNITARPHALLQGRVNYRMHHDWRNQFSSLRNPIFSRWISLNGDYKHIFTYDVGDFRQKYSPLTLYSPDIEMYFEPEIFAKQRREITDEVFLGDNERILPGVNLNFRAVIDPIFKELRVNVLGGRIFKADNGDGSIHVNHKALFDRFVVGFNSDMVFTPNISIGGTFLKQVDATETGSETDPVDSLNALNADVISGRVGYNSSSLPWDQDRFNFSVSLEGATTSPRYDKEFEGSIEDKNVKEEIRYDRGIALRGEVTATLGFGDIANLSLNAGYMNNNEHYINELAQSPSFLPQRIMNRYADNFNNNLRYYTPFDALYRQVFKFIASGDMIQNQFKPITHLISYSNGIMEEKMLVDYLNTIEFIEEPGSSELGYKDAFADPSVSLLLPLGDATPNRNGIFVDFNGEFLKKAIALNLGAKSLKSNEATLKDGKIKNFKVNGKTMLEVYGGVSADIGKFGNWWQYPFIVSAGGKLSAMNADPLTDKNGKVDKNNQHSDIRADVLYLSSGVYFQFWKRLALLAGLQHITSDIKPFAFDTEGKYQFVSQTSHLGAGLEYMVNEGGSLLINYTQVNAQFEDKRDKEDKERKNFKQHQFDLLLRVGF